MQTNVIQATTPETITFKKKNIKRSAVEKLSVVIITYNEEKNIGRCIDSVAPVADEIIVLDSFSADATVQIARQKGAIVQQESFEGYVKQKNKAFRMAAHDHILSLDADEALSPRLIESILEAKKDFRFGAYAMNRCGIYRGKEIRRGLWYPDRKIRLFDKRIGHCGGLDPHDKIVFEMDIPVHRLQGDLMHYTYDSYEEYLLRNDQVSSTGARSLFEAGRKVFWPKLLLSPAWAFVNGYFLRGGFLDGHAGWVIALNTANQCYQKYNKLRMLRQKPIDKLEWRPATSQA